MDARPPVPRDSGPGIGDSGPEPPDTSWYACPEDGFELDIECKVLPVPIDWEQSRGPRLDVLVRRVRAPRSRGALWLLAGGPGQSGYVYLYYAEELIAATGLDVYIPEHRGVGPVSHLGCPRYEAASSDEGHDITAAEWGPCMEDVRAQWGDDISFFSTSNAARDLGMLIEQEASGPEVFVYGASYGTYWAHRYLQFFPNQADGVILDSICSPGACRIPLRYAEAHDEVGARLLRGCNADPQCRARLGSDPFSFAWDVVRSLDVGHCPDLSDLGIDSTYLRYFLAYMLQDVFLRQLIPALLHRISRCSGPDLDAIFFLFESLSEAATFLDDGGSQVLYSIVVFSEMLDDPALSQEELEASYEDILFLAGFEPELYGENLRHTPTYQPGPEAPLLAETDVPMLMLNGGLDPQTPLSTADPIGEHFNGPNQTYVVMDSVPHGVIATSLYGLESLETCGMDLLTDFVADPHAELDLSCRGRVAGISFNDDFLASVYFGTETAFAPRRPALAGVRRNRASLVQRVGRLIRRPHW